MPARTRADPALVKALARAHRWKRLLESGRYGSLAELAAAEKIDRSYLAKTLRLTLLAPDIVEAILDGRQSCALALPALLESVPSLWDEQRSSMAETSDCASSTARPCRSTCDRRAPARAERPCRREPDIGGGDFVTTRQESGYPRVRTLAVPALLPPRARPPSSHLPTSILVRSIHTACSAFQTGCGRRQGVLQQPRLAVATGPREPAFSCSPCPTRGPRCAIRPRP